MPLLAPARTAWKLMPAALMLWAVTVSTTAVGAAGDYLTPALRARVEKLKADADYLPTNAINMEERARILWQWLNAYALNGGDLPVNITQAVAAVFAYPERASGMTKELDDLIFEMTLKDERPDAIGRLVADAGPFEARRFGANNWQTREPAADNFISIGSSNQRVGFVADVAPMRGMHGGFRSEAPALVFRVATGTLTEGDAVTVTYGDTSQGSRGFLMADFSSDRMPLPIYLAFNQDEPFLTLPIQPIRVIGGPLAGVHGFAPSVVTPGETFSLSVRAEDPWYNRARDGHPPIVIYDGDEKIAEVPASSEAISMVELALDEPGAHFLTVATRDASISGTVNPILVAPDPDHRIYWGDTHGHSGFAEGIGTPDRFMTWARDDARLDYVTHSEHDIWLDDQEWEVLRNNVSRFTREGAFIAYLGYEWTVNNVRGGHHNVLFRTPEGRDRIPVQFYPTLSRLYAGLRSAHDPEDVVIIPHAHQAGDYRNEAGSARCSPARRPRTPSSMP
ncbi:MAG: hypothetical protein P8Y69_06500 [Gammaproteobacteria bacterium]